MIITGIECEKIEVSNLRSNYVTHIQKRIVKQLHPCTLLHDLLVLAATITRARRNNYSGKGLDISDMKLTLITHSAATTV
jgi:hypothetical protein